MLASGPAATHLRGCRADPGRSGPQHRERCTCWRRHANVADEGRQ